MKRALLGVLLLAACGGGESDSDQISYYTVQSVADGSNPNGAGGVTFTHLVRIVSAGSSVAGADVKLNVNGELEDFVPSDAIGLATLQWSIPPGTTDGEWTVLICATSEQSNADCPASQSLQRHYTFNGPLP